MLGSLFTVSTLLWDQHGESLRPIYCTLQLIELTSTAVMFGGTSVWPPVLFPFFVGQLLARRVRRTTAFLALEDNNTLEANPLTVVNANLNLEPLTMECPKGHELCVAENNDWNNEQEDALKGCVQLPLPFGQMEIIRDALKQGLF